jgi:hypothetical protein
LRLYTDPGSGRQYYVDPDTGRTRWAMPTGPSLLAGPQPDRRPQGPAMLWAFGGLAVLILLGIAATVVPASPGNVQQLSDTGPTSSASRSSASRSSTQARGAAAPHVPATSRPRRPGPARAAVPTSAAGIAGAPTSTAASRSPRTRAPRTTRSAPPVGARPARCDPNYAGACVPTASDVDCVGGSGNGPAYVAGPVRVIGRDVYRLDADGDGIGCE